MAEQKNATKSDEAASWRYNPNEEEAGSSSARPPGGSSVSWTASEYIDHERTSGWYFMLAIASITLAAFIYLITRELFAPIITLVVGIIVAVAVKQKPRQMTYELTREGLRAGEKAYSYGLFKSFSVIRDGPLSSISLLPLKRFMPPVSAYFEPVDEEKIVSFLSDFLPYEERQLDAIDRLSRRLKL